MLFHILKYPLSAHTCQNLLIFFQGLKSLESSFDLPTRLPGVNHFIPLRNPGGGVALLSGCITQRRHQENHAQTDSASSFFQIGPEHTVCMHTDLLSRKHRVCRQYSLKWNFNSFGIPAPVYWNPLFWSSQHLNELLDLKNQYPKVWHFGMLCTFTLKDIGRTWEVNFLSPSLLSLLSFLPKGRPLKLEFFFSNTGYRN